LSLDTLHGPRTANIRNRHVGDLGNITTDAKGVVNLNLEDSIIQLYNDTLSIYNRTIIVHLLRDDGGQGGFVDSATTGYDYILF
jgi:Cu-Zn family superoxide dismutase